MLQCSLLSYTYIIAITYIARVTGNCTFVPGHPDPDTHIETILITTHLQACFT